MVVTAFVYMPFGLTHLPRRFHAETAESVATLAVVCTVLAFMLFFALIREIGPTRATVVTYVNPAVALLLGIVALGEPFTLGIAIGFPVIIAGSILATWAKAPPIRSAGDARPGRTRPRWQSGALSARRAVVVRYRRTGNDVGCPVRVRAGVDRGDSRSPP